MLRHGLRAGLLPLAIKAVEAATKENDDLADAALRDVGAELLTDLMQKRDLEQGHLQVIAYYQSIQHRPLLKRKPGRYGRYDHWRRDFAICITVRLACMEFNVPPTRSRESRRANRAPSGCSLVTSALGLTKMHLDEKTVQEKIWRGWIGEIVRHLSPERVLEIAGLRETRFASSSPF
jgi:hypothetical protein